MTSKIVQKKADRLLTVWSFCVNSSGNLFPKIILLQSFSSLFFFSSFVVFFPQSSNESDARRIGPDIILPFS